MAKAWLKIVRKRFKRTAVIARPRGLTKTNPSKQVLVATRINLIFQ
jgi:hypothetical protein